MTPSISAIILTSFLLLSALVQKQQTDRKADGLKGPVNTVVTEVATFRTDSGKLVEFDLKLAPIDSFMLQEGEEAPEMPAIILQCMWRLLQCCQMIEIQLDRLNELTPFIDQIQAPAPINLGPNRSQHGCLPKPASSRSLTGSSVSLRSPSPPVSYGWGGNESRHPVPFNEKSPLCYEI